MGIGGAASGTRVWKQRGQIYATVVVKATLALVPDAAMALSPPDPLDEDERADPSGKGLCAGGDMAPTLPQAELWIVGHAQGVPTAERRALDIRVALARDGAFIYEKRLSIGTGGAYGSPVRLPLGALGPLSKRWPIRARRLVGLDAALLDGPRIELPERFDWEYFHAAPADQRLPALRGDEWLILEGIYLDCPRLKTYLPRVTAAARVYGRDAELRLGRAVRIGLDSLHIDVDRKCCSMLWRGYFPISSQAVPEAFHVVGGLEWPGHPLAWVNPFDNVPARQQPIAPPPAAGSPQTTSLPDAPPIEATRPEAAQARNDAPAPSAPDSDPCVDTVQLTDSDARKLAQVAATPFEKKKATLKPDKSTVEFSAVDAQKLMQTAATPFERKKAGSKPDKRTAELSAVDAQKLAHAAATPFEANKEGLPSGVPATGAPQARAASADARRSRPEDDDPMGTTLRLGDADVQRLARVAVTPFVRVTAAAQPVDAPAVARMEAPAAAQMEDAVNVPDTLDTKQIAATVLPFVTASGSPVAPPPLLPAHTPEAEEDASEAGALSPDAPPTLGAFFLAAMDRAAARHSA